MENKFSIMLNPSPAVFGAEGAKEIKEKSVDRICEMRLAGKIPAEGLARLIDAVNGGRNGK